MIESYTVRDFNTEDWIFRPPHDGSTGIDLESLQRIHRDEPGFEDDRHDADSGFYFAVHLKHPSWTIYIYDEDGGEAWPMFLALGTTFDGCRETQGAPSSTGRLDLIASAALAVQAYLIEKGWVL